MKVEKCIEMKLRSVDPRSISKSRSSAVVATVAVADFVAVVVDVVATVADFVVVVVDFVAAVANVVAVVAVVWVWTVVVPMLVNSW